MRRYRKVVEWLGRRRLVVSVASRLQTPVDVLLMRISRGRVRTMSRAFPTLLLTTTGRRSGERRTVPLVFALHDSGAWVVADSNYGRDARPGWSANLRADPDATVELDGERYTVVARRAAPDECTVLWPRLDAVWANFALHRANMRREPRIWVLER